MHFLKRLALLPALVLVISSLAYLVVRIAPGGPFDRERAPASPETERALRARYHLDEPLWQQYCRFLGLWWELDDRGVWRRVEGGLVIGDFGPSLKYRGQTVSGILRQALPVSALLGAAAFGLAMVVGVPLGLFMAAARDRWLGHLGNTLAVLMTSIPALVLGPALVLVFAIKLRWLPAALWGSPAHLVLPAVTLAFFFAGRIARLTREGMLGVLPAGFITTARAKGLTGTAVFWKHALRVGILPVISYAGPLLADLLTGSFVVENIFQVPGVGVFFVNSLLNRDYTLLVGLVAVYAGLLVVLNLVVDLVYTMLDPRVRYD